jgi:DNA-binding NtrC family response regulator
MTLRICLIEDDQILGESLMERFRLEGLACDWSRYGRPAMSQIRARPYSAVLSDIRLPDMSGGEVFNQLRRTEPFLPPFLFITGFGTVDEAVTLLKQGAADYVRKPFDLEGLVGKLRKVAVPISDAPASSEGSKLGISPAMKKIEELLPKLAKHAHSVLITGASGVGKEVVARELHRLDPRGGDLPWVAVNCAGLAESLLEAELFGSEKGAYTGAHRMRRGVFELAEGGTLFLDEIGDMAPGMQAKILRAVQDRIIVRVGGENPVRVSVRLVCATHRDLGAMVAEGTFREDLYYRINTLQLRVPPLTNRREDIPWLARRFWDSYCREQALDLPYPGAHLDEQLLVHDWPGNARELKHVIEHACLFYDASSGAHKLSTVIDTLDRSPPATANGVSSQALADHLSQCERLFVTQRLEEHGWQIARTAESLAITRKNLWERMKRLGISRRPSPGH